jgi:hypothetical protein
MKKEWLDNYEQQELAEYKKFLDNFLQDPSTAVKNYFIGNRFQKVNNPLALTGSSNIWSQIPFYGTSIVPVTTLDQGSHIGAYGWGRESDINNLISLSRETGRVQFVLVNHPTSFANEKYNYLEPILSELRPPLVYNLSSVLFDSLELSKAINEFHYIADYRFIPAARRQPELQSQVYKFAEIYAGIKLLGYQQIIDKLNVLLVSDVKLASTYLNLYSGLIEIPRLDPFVTGYDAIYSVDSNLINEMSQKIPEATKLESKLFPDEIGNFLLRKLVFNAEGYHACVSLIDKYKQVDLHKLLESLQQGCNSQNVDLIKSNTQELSVVLDNLWNDAKNVARLSEGISYGFPAVLGIIGFLAQQNIVGYGGLLASLGIGMINKKVPFISDKISKLINKNYLVTIHDFKTKYNIKD